MIQQTEAQRLADELERRFPKSGKNAAAELRRLDRHELANNVWHEKTEWVQDTAQPHELGMHRADVLRQRIDRLERINAQLLEALESVVEAIVPFRSEHAPDWWKSVRAAIAAAKGEA
jgi:hypothetical protein